MSWPDAIVEFAFILLPVALLFWADKRSHQQMATSFS